MSHDPIDVAVEAKVMTITLTRPDRLNAFTQHMGDALIDAFDRADNDDDVRVVIVTGAGRAFCAGSDLGEGGATFATGPGVEAPRDYGGRVTGRIFAAQKPVIAAINGPAVGIGITMTLPMDFRLVASTARMGFVFTRRGLVMEAGSSWYLPRLVGFSQAAEWVYTGRLFDAAEAHAGGLVRSVHEPDALLPAAYALAREIADNTSAVSVAVCRSLMWRMLGADNPARAHIADSRAMAALGSSPDAYEGISAFLAKRPPVFTDSVATDSPDVFSDPQPSWTAELDL